MNGPVKLTSGRRVSQVGQTVQMPPKRQGQNARSSNEGRPIAVDPAGDGPRQLLSSFLAGKSEREYSPNETIFLQGEPATAVFYIEQGKVKLSVVSQNGKEAIVDVLEEGTFFGEGCLADEPVRVVTATALRRSKIIRAEKRDLLSLSLRVPAVAEEFLSQLASRNLRMQADLADHIFNSSEKRLARLLLNLARIDSSNDSTRVIPSMSQETLAGMVGTTRSRVSFFLNRFREFGFITYDRNSIQVHRSLLSVLSRDNRSSL